MTEAVPAQYALDVAALSDVGTERGHNEDCCGTFQESMACAIVGVADGVSSSQAGEVASQMAIEVMIRAYRERASSAPAGTRLYQAVQQANIEVYDHAIAVPELRGMATTLTAVAIEQGKLTAVHVGDSRLYVLHDGLLAQVTKDHTVAAEKARLGLISKEKARLHPDRCVLTRSLGPELIVNRDRITRELSQGDVVILCSDGLYNTLSDSEIAHTATGHDAAAACRLLVQQANERGTSDNVTAAVVRLIGATPQTDQPRGFAAKLRRFFRAG